MSLQFILREKIKRIETILELYGQINTTYLFFLYVKSLLYTFLGVLNNCVGERTSNDA